MSFITSKTVRTILLALFAVGLLTACGSDNTTSNTASSSATKNSATTASVMLKHSPAGTADLAWDPATHALTVNILLLGLVPDSKHPAHIHAGSCAKAGNVVYPLQDVIADETGSGSSTSVIKDVTDGIPATGWYINVHNGPGLSPETQFLPISCGNIANPKATTKSAQRIQILLGITPSPNQAASGGAQLTLSGGKLTVALSLQGLVPGSVHAAHIHSGSCGNAGKPLYDLKPIVANSGGKGSATTVISSVSSLPAIGWYISVHLTTDMTTQASDDSIACGDVLLSH